VIELGVADAPAAERARELLTASGIPCADVAEATTLRVTTHDGAQLVIEALRALDAGGIVPTTLAVHEPSLDDVFLALTGHRAEEHANGDGART
jgi:ABC-2 type transport system ATP-binding protein